MAKSRVREWNDASGASYREILRPDGSYTQWKDGQVVGESGPDASRAEAFAAGEYDAGAEAAKAGDAFMNSAYGKRLMEQEDAAGKRQRELSDRTYGLQKDQFGLSKDQFGQTKKEQDRRFGLDETELNRRFGLDQSRFGQDTLEQNRRYELDKGELDRRFGLDSAQFGINYFKTAADYAKTPRSWLDAVQFQSPGFLQRMTSGLANPSFGVQGTPPVMNSVSDRLAGVNGGAGGSTPIFMQQAGSGAPANPAVGGASTSSTPTGPGGVPLVDPATNIKKILAGSPPSEQSGFSDQDIAAVRLIAQMYKNGAGKLKEGTVESWSPEQLGLVQGVGDAISPNGGDTFLNQYKATRLPGKTNPYAASYG